MSEMSYMFKLVNAMELAKTARVGMSLTYFDVIELLGELNSLYEYIDVLESARRWIPVSEGPPQIGVRVLFYNNFTKNIHKGWYSGDEWTSEIGVFYNGDKLKRITHWMPLPESPNDTQTDTFVYGKESEE